MDNKSVPYQSITQVHIAELLAGIPWTETRTKQHVVSEVAQALFKILVYTHKSASPIQKWKNCTWFSSWEGETEGEQVCTLYAYAPIQESKVKPRKGQQFGWRKIPEKMWDRINLHNSETIVDVTSDRPQWQKMVGSYPSNTLRKATQTVSSLHNRFSALSEEETSTSQEHA